MALKDPTPGLRRFVNDSNDVTRIEFRILPGAEIEVDDYVAAQLPAAFKDPDAVAERDAARGKAAAKAEKKAAKEEAAAEDATES